MDELKIKDRVWLPVFLCVSGIALIVAALATAAVVSGGLSVDAMRWATVVQDILMFCTPPLLSAYIISRRPWRFLRLSTFPGIWQIVLAVAAMMASIPFMNAVIAWNESLTLPDSLASVEQWMRDSEIRASEATALLFGDYSVKSLFIGIALVGVLVGFSEEIFFRGGLQNILCHPGKKPHLAIWVTALVFSAVHVQFFGFFPRLLLGAFFGYMMYWSGSLWLAVICHALNNSMVVVSQWAVHNGVKAASSVETLGTDGGHWPFVAGSIVLTALAITALYRISAGRRTSCG